MQYLYVDPDYLEELAVEQDNAAKKALEAAAATIPVSTHVWVSHGVHSASSNGSFENTEAKRRRVGELMAEASANLAARLRTASETYGAIDEDLADSFNSLMR